jgi:MFS family permease
MNENTSVYRLNGKPPALISLLLLICFGSVAAIMIAPALPAIADYFHISAGEAQQTMSIFLLGFAVGQLIYGPLSNRFGRKPAIFIGIGVAALGSLACVLSAALDSFYFLLLSRLIMALGSSVGLTVAFTIIADFYHPHQARKVNATVIIPFAVMPGLATMVSGWLVENFGWQSCFYLFDIYTLLLFCTVFLLDETLQTKDFSALKPHHVATNYLKMLHNKSLVGNGFIYGCCGAAVYVFGSVAPFIAIHNLNISPTQYGTLNIIPYSGIIVGSISSRWLPSWFTAKHSVCLGLTIMSVSILAMLVFFVNNQINLITLLAPMFFTMIGLSLCWSNAITLGQSQVSDKSNATAVLNFICVFAAFLGTLIAGVLNHFGPLILPIMLVSLALMGVAIYFSVVYKERYD